MEQSEQACETAHCSRQPVLREGGASAALSALFTGHFLEGQGGPVQFDIAKFIFFVDSSSSVDSATIQACLTARNNASSVSEDSENSLTTFIGPS